MEHFFDLAFWQMVVSRVLAGVVVAVLLFKLGKRVVIHRHEGSGKGWKILVIFSWLFVLGGLYFFGHSPNPTLNDPFVGMGLSMMIFGYFILRPIGKLGVWWAR